MRAIAVLLFAVSVMAASVAPVNALSKQVLRNWTVGPMTPLAEPCGCPGVRAPETRASSNCLCLNASSYDVTLPNTLLGSLLPFVNFDPLFGFNLNDISSTPFYKRKWWFNTTFAVRTAETTTIDLQGVNYRADVWVNGQLIKNSTEIVGPFRNFVIDVTAAVADGDSNSLAVLITPSVDHTFPPNSNSTDLSITFVDWNPEPADRSMGILQPVVVTSGPNVRASAVSTSIQAMTSTHFNGTLTFILSQPADQSVWVDLRVNFTFHGGHKASSNYRVQLQGYESRFSMESTSIAGLPRSYLWNPWQMGDPIMHRVAIELIEEQRSVVLADEAIGFRNVSSYIDAWGSRQFVVNGNPIQIRGAGWAPDLFLRSNDTRLALEFEMVRHMNLNAIRLEGKFMWKGFFDLADRKGLMVLPGWCCCDSWQHWSAWGPEQFVIAGDSLRSQLRLLGGHPSVIMFFYSSDQLPPAAVEELYLSVFEEERWPNPTVSSASATPSNISGPSGVKMSGPYAWVPPEYWLLDSNETFQDLGGAWGFLTEGGPGSAPLTISSWKRTVPAEDQWSSEGLLSPAFNFHCANPMGVFRSMRFFVPGLNARYGQSNNAEAALYRGQAAAYEGIRAMFEGYTRNKLVGATGVIQWMMNNAWPSNMWHLFDYYLAAGGGYYAAKRACAPLAAMLSYADWSVAISNSLYHDRPEALRLNVTVYQLSGKPLYHATHTTSGSLPANGLIVTPIVVPMNGLDLPINRTVIVRLELSGSSEDEHPIINDYWVSNPMDTINWTASNWLITDVSSYANFAELSMNTKAPVALTGSWKRSPKRGMSYEGEASNDGDTIAILVSIRLEDGAEQEITPAMFNDNYFNLLPGERRKIVAWFPTVEGETSTKLYKLRVSSYNNATAV